MPEPASREARRARIRQLIETFDITSQGELADRLAAEGISASQGTLSRDLLVIGAVRVRGPGGNLVYAPADSPAIGVQAPEGQPAASDRLERLCAEVMLAADASGNLVVVKTPPGAAQYFASALDEASWHDVLGCIAGDDTLVLISRSTDGGQAIATRLRSLARAEAAE